MASIDLDKISKDAATVLQRIVESTGTPVDNNIINQIKAQLDNIDFKKPVTEEDTDDAIFDLLREVARATPTSFDDAAVVTAEIVYRQQKNGTGIISRIINRILKRKG